MQQKQLVRKLLPLITVVTIGTGGALVFPLKPAVAQITEAEVTAEVEKFNIVNDGLVALIQSFTLVLIMPMGVRAGSQLFRHLVLGSL